MLCLACIEKTWGKTWMRQTVTKWFQRKKVKKTPCAHHWKSYKCRSIVAQNPGNVHWCAILFTINMFALLHNVYHFAVSTSWARKSDRLYCLSVLMLCRSPLLLLLPLLLLQNTTAAFHTSYPLHRIGFQRCVLKIVVLRVSFRFRDRASGY